ncbi:MAG: class I SAM-dependent methyltransferase [Thermodesulfobacteriota bacterium]|nr:class I SAM-dependent methyltransferase [Thermodesulfobacteriota bacterium]
MNNASVERIAASYTEVPYYSSAIPESHPDRLATLGYLFGLSPAPVENCRLLELGCAGGGNIIPMAYHLPGSTFLGVELAANQAMAAQKATQDLGLENIRIENKDMLALSSSVGPFDYIICHGVFSWVPEPVQEKIFAIMSESLSEQGIGYISYNTYPGWHFREVVRHMMLYHAEQFDTPETRLNQGKAFINFIADAMANQNDPYGLLLRDELKVLKAGGDYYIFHEYMELVNSPIYFHQFVQRAERHGLQYLAESEFQTMFDVGIPDNISQTVARISRDIIQNEQYLDFLRNRCFRKTLICRKNLKLRRSLDASCLDKLLISSTSTPEGLADASPSSRMAKFRTYDGMLLETDDPFIPAGLMVLRESWPRALAFEDLVQRCLQRLEDTTPQGLDPEIVRQELGQGLLRCRISGAVELHSWQDDIVTVLSDRPRVSEFTHYQVQQHQRIVNRSHQVCDADPFERRLIRLLDGQHDMGRLTDKMVQCVEDGTFTVSEFDVPITDSEKIRQTIKENVGTVLSRLLDAGLLVE